MTENKRNVKASPRILRRRFPSRRSSSPAAASLTVTKNEILTALNKPEDWWPAVVLVRR